MKYLKPIDTKDSWSRELDTMLREFFYKAIYAAIMREIRPADEAKENAISSALVKAIRAGRIQYRHGVFTGEMSASISRELKAMGAAWDRYHKGWRIGAESLSKRLLTIISSQQKANDAIVKQVFKLIDQIPANVDKHIQGLDFGSTADLAISRNQKAFRATVTEAIGIDPTISPEDRKKMKAEYTQNLNRSIVKFSDEETERLREIVEKHVRGGRPRVELEDLLLRRPGVSRERARFIARQETALFTSELRKVHYQNAGLDRYRWKTMGDSRVRPEHRQANNRIFYWDQSMNRNPVLNANGEPMHPQEDFGCRCQAVPILEVIK